MLAGRTAAASARRPHRAGRGCRNAVLATVALFVAGVLVAHFHRVLSLATATLQEGMARARSGADRSLRAAAPRNKRYEICNRTDAVPPGWCAGAEGRTPYNPIATDVATPEDVVCAWTNMTYDHLRPLRMCTHDPAVDTTISRNLHRFNMWESSDMVTTLVRLVRSGTICTPERPFVLDLGLNIGVFSLLFLELGCHVVAFEPLAANFHRALASVRSNGLQERFTLLNNAVSNRVAPLYMEFNAQNPGGSSGFETPAAVGARCVMSVTIDGLFRWEGRPTSPRTGKPFTPSEVSFVKVDIESWDAAAFDGMQATIAEGHPIPFLTMEYNQPMTYLASRCWPDVVLHMLADAGYAFHDHTEALLDTGELLAAADATSERVPKAQRRGLAPAYELWMQHSTVDAGWGVRSVKHNLAYWPPAGKTGVKGKAEGRKA